ncbi:alpha/beta-hydrolase [Epithele typhae]|uniref:alpha/beta-hydrolase n=1 Tax=Epithele typhae TaxID=378194 RepID=UPI002007618F|nr:alpha/beta-hydrolase [Epithele typhae]KAH9926249.1 alpha/beta-hydrolase [Epithele typhae]
MRPPASLTLLIALCVVHAGPAIASNILRSKFVRSFPHVFEHAPSSSSPDSDTASTRILDFATVHGIGDQDTNSFLGIPYAQPPIGDLRLNVPVPIAEYNGTINATVSGNWCYSFVPADLPASPTWLTAEQATFFNKFDVPSGVQFSEDCLNLNVIAPASAKPGSNLPVVAYIFFGAFDFGGATGVDGRKIVKRSVEMNEPVVFVSMNHRLGPLGWLGGKDVRDAKVGNLGLQDQRTALRWIQRYVRNFGGDPTKVTLLGFSSGALSAGFHTVYNDDENLFRALWIESGAIQPVGWIDGSNPQAAYDTYSASVGCGNATDTLACIRHAPLEAVTNTSAVNASWSPRADGSVLLDLPQKLLTEGRARNVPVVAGNAEDEGTLFALNTPNITSDAEFIQALLASSWFGNLSAPQGPQLLDLYPNDPALGAPYGTGDDFQYGQMHKRFASVMGDVNVDANRRLFLREMSKKENVWSYFYRRRKIPGFGSTHGSEVPDMYQAVGSQLQDLFIHFVNTLDPSGTPGIAQAWPKYNVSAPVLLEFSGNSTLRLKNDTYREEPIDFLINLGQKYPWTV